MRQRHKPFLLTSQLSAALAATVLAAVLSRSGYNLLHHRATEVGWIFPGDSFIHGWLFKALNIALYGYVCWLALVFIRASRDLERVFFVGWLLAPLLWPAQRLLPQLESVWDVVANIGLLISFGATLTLLARPYQPVEPPEQYH